VSIERAALGFTIAAFLLAAIAILVRQGTVTYVAIVFAVVAIMLRWRIRRGRP
jgi:membrane protein implicated in regulation of membrane protease activity